VTVAEDFSVSSATASQTVTAGQTTGAYQLTVAPNPPGSSFGGAVQLACTGLPRGANFHFSPSEPPITGSSAVDVVMTISTAGAASANSVRPIEKRPFSYAIWLMLPAVMLGGISRRKAATFLKPLSVFITALLLLLLAACAGVSAGGGGGGGTQNPVSYKITV